MNNNFQLLVNNDSNWKWPQFKDLEHKHHVFLKTLISTHNKDTSLHIKLLKEMIAKIN